MIFFFSKGSARLSVATELDGGTGEYVVKIERPNQDAEVHRFSDKGRCSTFLSNMQRDLTVQDWTADSVGLIGAWPSQA